MNSPFLVASRITRDGFKDVTYVRSSDLHESDLCPAEDSPPHASLTGVQSGDDGALRLPPSLRLQALQ